MEELAAFDALTLKNWPFEPVRHGYMRRDVMLYAMGVIGACEDGLDDAALKFVYERNLACLPSMASVLGSPGFWLQNPATGVDWKRMVHAEERLTFHAALPVEGVVEGRTRVTHVVDKGCGKGALLVVERKIMDASTGALVATGQRVSLLRGNGGFSESGQRSDSWSADAADGFDPDKVAARWTVRTRRDAAFLYRLSGDYNPLHVDPEIAGLAGFERPILHGLCTFGIAGFVLLKHLCGSDPSRMTALSGRFRSHVIPGETLDVAVSDGSAGVHFNVRSVDRDVTVLSHGWLGIQGN